MSCRGIFPRCYREAQCRVTQRQTANTALYRVTGRYTAQCRVTHYAARRRQAIRLLLRRAAPPPS